MSKEINILQRIQSELKAPKNLYNKFGKYHYRNCEGILESVKPLLKEYNVSLVLTDKIKDANGILYVESTVALFDENRNLIAKAKAQAGIDVDKKGMDYSQAFGSSSSYARKYALNGLFLIDDTKDADATNDHGRGEASKPLPAKRGNLPSSRKAINTTPPAVKKDNDTKGYF